MISDKRIFIADTNDELKEWVNKINDYIRTKRIKIINDII